MNETRDGEIRLRVRYGLSPMHACMHACQQAGNEREMRTGCVCELT